MQIGYAVYRPPRAYRYFGREGEKLSHSTLRIEPLLEIRHKVLVDGRAIHESYNMNSKSTEVRIPFGQEPHFRAELSLRKITTL